MLLLQFTRLYFIAWQVLPGTQGHRAKEGAGVPMLWGEGSEPDVPERSPVTLQPSAFTAEVTARWSHLSLGPSCLELKKASGNPYPSSQGWGEGASSSPQPIP